MLGFQNLGQSICFDKYKLDVLNLYFVQTSLNQLELLISSLIANRSGSNDKPRFIGRLQSENFIN